MTLNELIKECNTIAQQLSSGDVPLKCRGNDVMVYLEDYGYDEPEVEIDLLIRPKYDTK